MTYQDFSKAIANTGLESAVKSAVNSWKNSPMYKTALAADSYDHQRNITLVQVSAMKADAGVRLYGAASNDTKNEISSNFFHRLNTQRCNYLLGNGLNFPDNSVNEHFGSKFDTAVKDIAYKALIHGVCFGYWSDKLYSFELTEFAPLWDEETGVLMAGVRFWQIATTKPTYYVLYEADGYTKFTEKDGVMHLTDEKHGYIQTVRTSAADGETIIGEQNYSALPIIPMWGSRLKQSTLIGLRSSIDAYDIVNSGFADDLNEMQEIFWILENYNGMTQDDLTKFFRRLKWFKVAEMDTSEEGKITPYKQEVPYQSRQVFLDNIRKQIYEGFGALDVHQLSAGSTNDHIDAAYQPLDEEADDLEFQVIEFVQQLGALLGIAEDKCTPQFKRNRISNQSEQVAMIVQEAPWLDEETVLKKLPNVTPDEIDEIMKRKAAEDIDRGFGGDE